VAFTFDPIFAADPNNPANVASNAAIIISDPDDPGNSPIAITDPTGSPLPNPITVNKNGFGSAFMADIDRVAWSGGGFTGFFTSYEGLKAVAVAAQNDAGTSAAAAASSAAAAVDAAALVGAPADSAIAAAINGTTTETKAALSTTYAAKSVETTKLDIDAAPALISETIAQDGTVTAAAAAAVNGAAAGLSLVKTSDPGVPNAITGDYLEEVVDLSGRVSERTLTDGTKYLPRAKVDALTQGDTTLGLASIDGYRVVTVDTNGRIAEPDAMTLDGRTPSWVLQNYAKRTAQALLGIACFGDSMTEGTGGSGTSYPGTLQTLTSVPVSNYGTMAQMSTEVALRTGGLDVFVTVTGDTIPASGSVAVTAVLPTGTWRSDYAWTFSGSLAGIPGTLSKAVGNTWTFTRAAAGTATACPPESRWQSARTPAPLVGRIYWAGRNNPDVVINARDARAVVTAARRVNAPILVMSVCNDSSETVGTAGYNTIAAVNTELEKVAGSDYFDLRGWLIRRGLAEAGITPTTQDNTDITNDVIPSSLRSDPTHLNAAGYAAVGRRLYRLLTDKGWL